LKIFRMKNNRILVTKTKIAGFGMNFQNSNNMMFFGLSDSWEAYYQAIRRQYRFGQTKEVNVHIVMSEAEREIFTNVMNKEEVAKTMIDELINHVKDFEKRRNTIRIEK